MQHNEKKANTFSVSTNTGNLLDLIPKNPGESDHQLAITAQPALLENGYCVAPYVVRCNNKPTWRMAVIDLKNRKFVGNLHFEFKNGNEAAQFQYDTDQSVIISMRILPLYGHDHFTIVNAFDQGQASVTYHNDTLRCASQKIPLPTHQISMHTITTCGQSIIFHRSNENCLQQQDCFSPLDLKQVSPKQKNYLYFSEMHPMCQNVVASLHNDQIKLWRMGTEIGNLYCFDFESEKNSVAAASPKGTHLCLYTPKESKDFSLLEMKFTNPDMTKCRLQTVEKFVLDNDAKLHQLHWGEDDVLMAHVLEKDSKLNKEVHRLKAIQLTTQDNKNYQKTETPCHTFSFAPERVLFCDRYVMAYGQNGEFEFCNLMNLELYQELCQAILAGTVGTHGFLPAGVCRIVADCAYHPGIRLFNPARALHDVTTKGNVNGVTRVAGKK
jgi:hypothetical protein